MLRNLYNSLSFEAQLTLKVTFMLFTAFFVMLSTKGLLGLFDTAYATSVHSAVKVDVVVGDYFNHFTVFAFATYGFFFSFRKL
ncbi:hypothetical protein MUB04_15180 [Acinetobacter indicus]|uniref:hypothetical protein n=1 Tax=Acinetobacter TaxID=469 RepID=UPI0015D313E8|nr:MULTISPECIES: hypothetical protein [Acinetobacter]MCP0917878.1 hypothetical protein [Acinetobacter indicus]